MPDKYKENFELLKSKLDQKIKLVFFLNFHILAYYLDDSIECTYNERKEMLMVIAYIYRVTIYNIFKGFECYNESPYLENRKLFFEKLSITASEYKISNDIQEILNGGSLLDKIGRKYPEISYTNPSPSGTTYYIENIFDLASPQNWMNFEILVGMCRNRMD